MPLEFRHTVRVSEVISEHHELVWQTLPGGQPNPLLDPFMCDQGEWGIEFVADHSAALDSGMHGLQRYDEDELVENVKPVMLSFKPDVSRTLSLKTGYSYSKGSRDVSLKEDSSEWISMPLTGSQLQGGGPRWSTASLRQSGGASALEPPSCEVAVTVKPAPAPFHRTSIVSFLPRCAKMPTRTQHLAREPLILAAGLARRRGERPSLSRAHASFRQALAS